MALTAAEANAQLGNIETPEELRDLIRQLDVSAPGDVTVLYSGGDGLAITSKVVKEMTTLMAAKKMTN